MRLHRSLLNILIRGLFSLSILCFLVPVHAKLHGQQEPNVTVTFDVQLIDADVIYLGDLAFNLQNSIISDRSPVFFYLNVISDQPTNVMFRIDVIAETEVTDRSVNIFSGLTNPVKLEANRPRHFTSRDLGKGGALEIYQADMIDINSGRNSIQKLTRAIRTSSRLPDGIYYFTLTAFTLDDIAAQAEPYQPREEVIPSVERQLRIVNPSSVELLSPMDGERLFTQFPHFQWRSDTRDIILRVFEMRDGLRSPEEAIENIPYLETRLSDVNQFFYPQTGPGVRTLEPGKRYVWYVESVYRTSSNRDEAIISELNTFSIVDPGKEGTSGIILIELGRLLDDKYGDILAELEQGNFDLIDRIFHDGSEISIEEFQVLMAAIRAGINNAEISNVSIR